MSDELKATPAVEVLAYSVPDTCVALKLGRSSVFKMLNPDPVKREGLPYLRSYKVGKVRRIPPSAVREVARQLEHRAEEALGQLLTGQSVEQPKSTPTRRRRLSGGDVDE
jgi:hypothetical protein